MRNLALPLRRLRRLAPCRVELDEAGAGVGEAVAMEGGNGRDALMHALVAVDERSQKQRRDGARTSGEMLPSCSDSANLGRTRGRLAPIISRHTRDDCVRL